MPKNLQSLLDQDPATFMYLYLQVDLTPNVFTWFWPRRPVRLVCTSL